MTVSEVERTMPAPELAEWMALQEFDPLPDFWLAVGQVLSTILNVNRSKDKAPTKPADLFPFLKGPARKQTGEEMARALTGVLETWH